jgi:hypothetical protein
MKTMLSGFAVLAIGFAPLSAQLLVDVSIASNVQVKRFVAHKNSMFVVAEQGTFRTDDRGVRWKAVIINGTTASAINTYRGALYAKTSNGIFTSLDDGTSWRSTTADVTAEFVEVGRTLYTLRGDIYPRGSSYASALRNGKLFHSTTGGITWNEIQWDKSQFAFTGEISAIIGHNGNIYAGANGFNLLNGSNSGGTRIIRSQDGVTWTKVNDGLDVREIDYSSYAVGAFASVGNTLIVTMINRVRVGTIDGLSQVGENVYILDSTQRVWQVVTPQLRVNTLASCSKGFIGGTNLRFSSGGYVLRLYSGGLFTISAESRTWRQLTNGFDKLCAGDFVFVPTSCLNVQYPTFDSAGYLYFYNILFPDTFQIHRTAQPICDLTVSVQESSKAANELPIFPNPATDRAYARYTLPASGYVRVELCTSLGQLVRTAFEGTQPAGEYTTPLDLAGLARGVYICRVHIPSGTQTNLVSVTE